VIAKTTTERRIRTATARMVSLLAVVLFTTGCGFEHERNVTGPSSSSSNASSDTTSSGNGTYVGNWASQQFTIPSGTSCTNFQWTITSQSNTSLAGTFTVDCSGNVTIEGNGSGQLVGENQVALTVSGTATIAGFLPCPFTLNGTGTLEDRTTLTIPYSGTTCLGPVSGTETLRKHEEPAPPPPPPPAPEPPPQPPPPSGNGYHVGPGPLSVARARQVLDATSAEFPWLSGPQPTPDASFNATAELLRRMIWHLQVAGYQAARQRNPSGGISKDKLTIFIDGQWHAYDVFIAVGTPGVPANINMLEVYPASPVADTGIPD
jgi:hypothetical protein